MATDLDINPIGGSLGAEVLHLDVRDVDDVAVAAIQAALLDHKVLFFPGQGLDRDGHVAFARHFGELEVFHSQVDQGHDADLAHPEVLPLRSTHGLIADVWHTDVTWAPSPPKASIVHMVETPSKGGDTMWSNQSAAFAGLTAPMQELLVGLTAVHTGRVLGKPGDRATHPVVRTHPDTGQPALYVNRQFTSHIVELSPGESDTLLGYLYSWSEQPQFTCRYRWTEGTLAMWDNRCTQHYVVNDFDEPRTLERVTVLGDDPQPAAPPRWPAFDSGSLSAASAPSILRG